MKAEPNECFDCYHAHSLVIPIAGEGVALIATTAKESMQWGLCYAEYFLNRSRSKGRVLRACMLLRAWGERDQV